MHCSLIDPHTHIKPLQPASQTLADILGYHYYTELAHSAGMPRGPDRRAGAGPAEKCAGWSRIWGRWRTRSSTAGSSRSPGTFFGFDGRAAHAGQLGSRCTTRPTARWPRRTGRSRCCEQSRLEAVFLTNEFDDPLEGFDTRVYIPCLRTDDLVFHLAKPEVRRAAGVGDRTLR